MPNKWRKKKKGSEAPEAQVEHIARTTARLEQSIVSSSGNAPKRSYPRKKVLIIAALVAVLLSLIGFIVWRETRPAPKAKSVVTEEGVKLRKYNDDQLVTEVQKLMLLKKFSSAGQLVKYQDKPKSERHNLLLASILIDQGKPRDALQVYLNMEKSGVGTPWKLARDIGQQYERLGDTGKAVTYYKKAIDLLKQADNVPVKDDEIYFLSEDIKRLGGQP
jgi:hypothetical protein